jgi:hypothetical protein
MCVGLADRAAAEAPERAPAHPAPAAAAQPSG